MNPNLSGLSKPIPQELRHVDSWCRWQITIDSGKRRKRPFGSTRDPGIKEPFNCAANTPITSEGGIGLVMTDGVQLEDETWVIAFDIDACRNPKTGVVSPWAKKLWMLYGRSYTEITPSGTGLRLYIKVRKKPEALPKVPISHDAPPGVDKNPEIQVYGLGAPCYVTVTGQKYSTSAGILHDFDNLDDFCKAYKVDEIDRFDESDLPKGKGDAPTATQMLERIKKAPNGQALLDGDWEALKLPSASEAWYRLVKQALRVGWGHGQAVVDFLLTETGFGMLTVDSQDPDKYSRRNWVSRDVARIASKTNDKSPDELFGPIEMSEEEQLKELLGTGDTKARPKSKELRGRDLNYDIDQLIEESGRVEFLVEGLLVAPGITQMYSDPGVGKSTIAANLAAHVISGATSWCGHEMKRGPGRVYIIVGEDPVGIAARLRASMLELKVDPDLFRKRVLLSRKPGAFTDKKETAIFRESLELFVEDGKRDGAPVRLIIVDTQSRNMGPGKEVDNDDLNDFVEGLLQLLGCSGALIFVLHHTGHANKGRGRGGSAMLAAVDSAIQVSSPGEGDPNLTMDWHKPRNFQKPQPIGVRLESRTLNDVWHARIVEASGDDSIETGTYVRLLTQEDVRKKEQDDIEIQVDEEERSRTEEDRIELLRDAIRRDSRAPLTWLAKVSGLRLSAVSRRLKKMGEDGELSVKKDGNRCVRTFI